MHIAFDLPGGLLYVGFGSWPHKLPSMADANAPTCLHSLLKLQPTFTEEFCCVDGSIIELLYEENGVVRFLMQERVRGTERERLRRLLGRHRVIKSGSLGG